MRNLTRRTFMASAPKACLTASTMAQAAPALDLSNLSEDLLCHAVEINRLLERSKPEGANLKGVQWKITPGTIDLWASAITEAGRLWHIRAKHYDGWREQKVVLLWGGWSEKTLYRDVTSRYVALNHA